MAMFSRIILIIMSIAFVPVPVSPYNIVFKDPGLIPMGQKAEIKIKINLNYTEIEEWDNNPRSVKLNFYLTDEKSWAINLINNSLEFLYEEMLWNKEKSLLLESIVIGTDSLYVTSMTVDQNNQTDHRSFNFFWLPRILFFAGKNFT